MTGVGCASNGCLPVLRILKSLTTTEWSFYYETLNPLPPSGEIPAEDFLKPINITPYRLAKDIHVPLTRIVTTLSGKPTVTVDTALSVSRFFGY